MSPLMLMPSLETSDTAAQNCVSATNCIQAWNQTSFLYLVQIFSMSASVGFLKFFQSFQLFSPFSAFRVL